MRKSTNSRKTSFLSKNCVCSKQPGHIIQLNGLGESGESAALSGGRGGGWETHTQKAPTTKKNTLTILLPDWKVGQSPIYLKSEAAVCNSQRSITQKSQEEGHSFSSAAFCSDFNRPYDLTERPIVINRKMDVCQIIAKSKYLSGRF